MIVAKIGEDYARELTGAKFLAEAFFGRACNMKTRIESYFKKSIFRNLPPFAQTTFILLGGIVGFGAAR